MLTRVRAVVLVAVLGAATGLATPARAQSILPGPCETSLLPSGAGALICVPLVGWNGELFVFAHGYTAPHQPLAFQNLTLPDGTVLPAVVESLGYAFATTTYRQNGLAILEGADDIRELINAFTSTRTVPLKTHLVGVSEGGLVATLLAERSPSLFTSVLAACGPAGSFTAQIDYLGDFRVLFDYFFPGVIPGSPVSIPPSVMAQWDTVYVPRIAAAMAARPDRARELMRTARSPFDPANPATMVNTAIDVLWYNVFGTNDATDKLGGNPFGNRTRWYFGSSNDLRLNLLVQRFAATPAARAALGAYETNGDLSIPLVTLHTLADDVIPVWHELVYLAKFDPAGRGRFLPFPVNRYGHCNFTTTELLGAFAISVAQP